MRPYRKLILATALASSLAGCAGTGPGAPVLPYQRLSTGVVAGQSTREQVLQALGPATSVKFDNGYQVWMYRFVPAAAKPASFGRDSDTYGEFVILFRPDGIVGKTRTREQ